MRELLSFNATSTSGKVNAILIKPINPIALVVLAHGAGAGMTHRFMERIAELLADESIASFRFNFPYIEKRKKVPDVPAVAMKTVQSAVNTALGHLGQLPVFAGGKSFGGRMTSQAAASGMLPAVRGLVFFGFPLHPPGKPASERAAHLFDVEVPMLFLQGTRDTLATFALMKDLCYQLGDKTELVEVAQGDHSFHVKGMKDDEVLKTICNQAAAWVKKQL